MNAVGGGGGPAVTGTASDPVAPLASVTVNVDVPAAANTTLTLNPLGSLVSVDTASFGLSDFQVIAPVGDHSCRRSNRGEIADLTDDSAWR